MSALAVAFVATVPNFVFSASVKALVLELFSYKVFIEALSAKATSCHALPVYAFNLLELVLKARSPASKLVEGSLEATRYLSAKELTPVTLEASYYYFCFNYVFRKFR